MSKVQENLPIYPLKSDESEENLEKILAQKFRFLGRGLQSFVFCSEDDQYVLKLLQRPSNLSLYKFCSRSFPFWGLKRLSLLLEKELKAVTSYSLALSLMKEETALVYVHLEHTSHLPSSLTLIDPLNISHQIDPNNTGFLLQRKVVMAYPAIEGWIQNGDLASAKRGISSLVQLFFWKWKHHITDSDPLIRTNYGFIGTKAIQIDVGPLSLPTQPPSFQEFSSELKRIMTSLKIFLMARSPELATYLDRELDNLLSSGG